MKTDRMGCSLLPFTSALASHTRWGISCWNEFEARNVLTKLDGTIWNSGAFAPVSLAIGWGIPQNNIAGLCLSPDMVPETGVVKVETTTTLSFAFIGQSGLAERFTTYFFLAQCTRLL